MSPANFMVAPAARRARLVSGLANGIARERRAPAERPKGWEDESRWRPRGGNSRASTVRGQKSGLPAVLSVDVGGWGQRNEAVRRFWKMFFRRTVLFYLN